MGSIGMAKSMRDRIIETEIYKSGEWFFPKDLVNDIGSSYAVIGDVLSKMNKSGLLKSDSRKASIAYAKFTEGEKLARGKWI